MVTAKIESFISSEMFLVSYMANKKCVNNACGGAKL